MREHANQALKVMFAPLGEIGHVSPFLGVCRALTAAGHEVAIVAGRSFEAQFLRAGVRVAWHVPPGEVMSAAGEELWKRQRDPRWLARWFAFTRSFSMHGIVFTTQVIDSFRPDIVCVDSLNYASAVAAERAGVPWAAVSTNFAPVRLRDVPCEYLDVGAATMGSFVARLAAQGYVVPPTRLGELVSPAFNGVFTTEAFAPPAEAAHAYSSYLGPPRVGGTPSDDPAFPWEALDAERPLIYVASGGGQSLSFDGSCVLRLAHAGARHGQVVIAAQTRADDEVLRAALPPGCVMVRSAPQRALLDRAAVAVLHGGANSVNECLDRGVPMLILPLGKDQPVQAALVRRAGVGLVLDPETSTEDECAAALATLIGGGEYRARAAALRASYQATDSSATLAAALIGLAQRTAVHSPP